MNFEIVTPTGVVFRSQDCDSVVLPTSTGEIEVLPMHVPLTAETIPGEVIVKKASKTERLAVDKGYVRVIADSVSMLVEAAINEKSIDLKSVENAEERAREALEAARKQHQIDPAELERLEAIARFAIAQKLVKK